MELFDTNNHPADELYQIRSQIKTLQEREKKLKGQLEALPEHEREGSEYKAVFVTSQRDSLNTKALYARYGKEEFKEFMNSTAVVSLRLEAIK